MRRSVTKFAVMGLSALVLATPASAWDYPGHRIVGAIADITLQQYHKKTYQQVRDLLQRDVPGAAPEQRTLSQVAVFPDCAKNEEEFCGRRVSAEEIEYVLRNLVHKSFHFTNSPLGQKTYLSTGVGAEDTDVIQMITHTVNQLRNKSAFKQDVRLTKTEALWLLAHLVGDIHQPLHVGQGYYDKDCKTLVNPNDPADKNKAAISTFGGNTIKFAAPEPAVPVVPSLHIYWDSTTIARAMRADGYADLEQAFAKKLASTLPAVPWEMTGDPATWAAAWYAEMIDLAQQAYTRPGIVIDGQPDGPDKCKWTVTVDDAYETWAQDLARDQLRKAGFRLAALLVAIFP